MRLQDRFDWGRQTYVMGILNVTPDSFSGDGVGDVGGETVRRAVGQARAFAAAGADILDIGGESTRPGSEPLTAEAERDRVVPAITAVRAALPDIAVSVDTHRAAVAEAALEAGADMINDVWGLRADPALAKDGPLTLDISGRFYFKPESGNAMWFSPHDETPMPPSDAVPEELAVAQALDLFGRVFDARITQVERTWAGLRSFAPDRKPVIGWDPQAAGLFWFAGQGGFGIQTAPAAARLAAQLFLDAPRDAMTQALDAQGFAPARFG